MRPLTDATAKPLLMAGGRRLIEWQLEALARAGVRDIVINTAHLPQQFEDALGDGARHGVRLAWSREGERAEDALETLGGIVRALPRLGSAAFIVVSGDIVTDYDYRALRERARAIDAGAADAHLVLVDNPPFHPRGDMGLADGLVAPRSRTAPHLRQHRRLRAAPLRRPRRRAREAVSLAVRGGARRARDRRACDRALVQRRHARGAGTRRRRTAHARARR